VENAIAHTDPSTTVEIVVGTDGTVIVRDEGPGIPANQRELIFQRFWRGDRRHLGNAGLGLAIVARIIKAHGGHIEVRDAPGHGAIFSISLRQVAAAPSQYA
jgi:signal transduction histidine kinase